MIFTLKPQMEALIQKRLESGIFQDIDEVIYRALESQDAEEAWLQLRQGEVSETLDRAMAEFDRGEGIPASEVPGRLRDLKAALVARGES